MNSSKVTASLCILLASVPSIPLGPISEILTTLGACKGPRIRVEIYVVNHRVSKIIDKYSERPRELKLKYKWLRTYFPWSYQGYRLVHIVLESQNRFRHHAKLIASLSRRWIVTSSSHAPFLVNQAIIFARVCFLAVATAVIRVIVCL